MLKKLKTINVFLILGVLLLLLPLLSYILVLYVEKSGNADPVRWIENFIPFQLIDIRWQFRLNPEYYDECYFSIAYYLAAIILAMVLFVRSFGSFAKEITRVFCVMAAIVVGLHFVHLSCKAVLLLLNPINEVRLKLYMRFHALPTALAGYLFIIGGLVVSWFRTKTKRCKAEVTQ